MTWPAGIALPTRGFVAYRQLHDRTTPFPGGPGLAQQRRLVTEIPGPARASCSPGARPAWPAGSATCCPCSSPPRAAACSSTSDGNSLIDFGSGIAVTSVGNSAPRVAAGVREQAERFTHTCFMVTPYEGYVAVCEELARRTPGDHEKRSALFNSGRGGGGERGQDRPARHRPPGDRRVRPRLPRPHQPDHGADREEHALQGQVRPVRRGDLPDAHGLPVPLAGRPGGVRRGRARRDHRAHPHPGGRGQRRRGAHRADPGRGRLHRAAGRLPAGAGRVLPRARHPADRRRDPERVLPDRRLVRLRPRGRRSPTWSPPRRASRAGCRWPR